MKPPPKHDGSHDLMLQRIAEGLKREDESNAEMWRDKGPEERFQAFCEISDFMNKLVEARGFPIEYEPLNFPRIPEKSR